MHNLRSFIFIIFFHQKYNHCNQWYCLFTHQLPSDSIENRVSFDVHHLQGKNFLFFHQQGNKKLFHLYIIKFEFHLVNRYYMIKIIQINISLKTWVIKCLFKRNLILTLYNWSVMTSYNLMFKLSYVTKIINHRIKSIWCQLVEIHC